MVEIKFTNHKDNIERLLELHKIVYGTIISPNEWIWRYTKNPVGGILTSELVVAEDKGRLVGANCFMPLKFYCNKTMVAGLSCNTMVHPNYRNQGIFLKMIQCAQSYLPNKDISLLIGFPNSNSLPGFEKLGWEKLMSIKNFSFEINPDEFYLKKYGKLGASFMKLYRIFSKQGIFNETSTSTEIGVKISNECPGSAEPLAIMNNSNKIQLVSNIAFLKWRLDNNPKNKYGYITLTRDGVICGYAIFSIIQEEYDLRIGRIVDCLIDTDENYQIIISKTIEHMEKLGCHKVYMWENDCMRQQLLLNTIGFKSPQKFPYNLKRRNEEFFIIKPLLNVFPKILPEYWNPTMIYSDVC